MKNLQISDNDLIGNRFNGHDLHRYLRQQGIVSNQLVRTKHSDDRDTYVVGDGFNCREACNDMINKIEKRYGTHSLHYPFSFSIFTDPLFLETDVVHYHLIHNYFFNLSLLPLLTALKPSILTIHEPFFTTGHCIQPLDCERWKTGCGDCPYVNLNFALDMDVSALNWEIKRDIFKRSQLDIIVASKHMQNWVKQSPILSHFDAHLIPFGLDLTRFAPGDAGNAKKKLGIPQENIVLCFRADLSPFKGLKYITEALQRLSVNVPLTLLTVGCVDLLDSFRGRFQIIDNTWHLDDNAMLDFYRAADIFLMPSTAEAFGMMAMEAMACGKPVVVFDGTALPETIFAPQGGIAVPQGDVDAMTHELEQLISNREKRLQLGEQARKLAVQHYNNDNYVSRVIDVYNDVIDKRIITDRSKYIIAQLKKAAEQSRSRKTKAISAASTSLAPMPAETELALIKSSVYFKIYDKLRKRRHLRLISDAAIKPTIRFSWKALKKARGFVRQFLF
jgi:glycosyltransferase involved in cell wall biosynthesis